MRFKNPSDVGSVVYYLRQADVPRSSNRALVNQLFNGDPPWTPQEEEENNINTNTNFLDAAKIAHDARNTFNNAFLKPGNFFNITLDSGPLYKRSKWQRIITEKINRCMKRSLPYIEVQRAEFAQTVLHGIGPSFWEDNHKWIPYSVPICDLLVPSRTRVSLDNLDYFVIRRQFTYEQFRKMTKGSKVDKGWNMKMVNQILKEKRDEYLTNASSVNIMTPEQVVESQKSDEMLYDNEAIPTIDCDELFYNDDGEGWKRKMIKSVESESSTVDQFLYAPDRVIAPDRSHLLHVMFGDGSNVAPFRYHSVRGLGWLLYSVCHLQNRLRCKFTDSVFEQFLWYFRVSNPEDRERFDKVDLHHLGILPEGMDFVKGQDRYQINQGLVAAAFSMNRQTMAESASQFRQDIDNGTSREMTAQEVMTRMQSANAMIGSMLMLAYIYQQFQYNEICRRFAIKNSSDKDVEKFQEDCKKEGVPAEMIDYERWNIEPERVLGAGNKTLEIAQAKELMAVRPLLDPEPQREVLHMFVEAVSDDAKLANRLVPIDKKIVSDSVHDAQLASATLMMGMPVSIKTGMNHIEYIESLMNSMGSVIKKIQGIDNVGTVEQVIGLSNMAQHISEHIAILSEDKSQKDRVKKYSDALNSLMNVVKGFAQRSQEKNAQGNGGITPEAQAKIQSQLLLAQTNAQIKDAKAQQQMQQKEASFRSRQEMEAEKHQMELGQQVQQTRVDVAAKDLTTAADIRATRNKSNSP